MAAKQDVVDLAEIFSKYTEEKKIDRNTLVSVLEDSFRSVISKMVGSDENYDVIINAKKGDLEIYRNREVVADEDLEDENKEITLSEVHKIEGNEDMNIGDTYAEQVNFSDFGRRAVLNLRQTLGSKILDLQKDNLYNKYKEKVGTVISAEVYQVWKKEMLLVDDEGNEMSLPKSEQIPGDFYRKGDKVTAVVAKVDNRNNDPKIILSRTSPLFLQRLFERDVPEILDGLITIRKIARIPGERAKVAVESYDERIDPVGACVGMKGARIHGIVRELRNENIDVIQYTDNLKLFISRALSPAHVSDISVFDEHKRADVFLHSEEISLAIGKNGNNIKLANMLTEYKIEVFRDDADGHDANDYYLDEFLDEIDAWVIEALKNIGCSTAKEVIKIPRQELIDRTDLEEETIDEVLDIINEQFRIDEADVEAADQSEEGTDAPAEEA
ncbi:MAG: transcription termination/antitermination protein NusA [Bacteroidales bacterium]|nr:transcription termination/antitermination protein NusA [Candidatus Physcocola equi]